jgi:hypothetical protein
MSGALWFFFWDEPDWTGGSPPAPAPAPAPDPGSGGGKGRGRGKGRGKLYSEDYPRLEEDFWHVRENYLSSIQDETLPVEPDPIPTEEPVDFTPTRAPPQRQPDYIALPRYISERAAIISALRLATTLESLKGHGARLIEINYAIAVAKRLKAEADEREEEAARIIRSARRQRRLESLRLAGTLLVKTLHSLRL